MNSQHTYACGKCGRSPWVHYMKGAGKGWLFCDDGFSIQADLPLGVIADTYLVAGRKIPAKLADAVRTAGAVIDL